MPEPSLELLQTLMERMLEQQRQVVDRLERVERALLEQGNGCLLSIVTVLADSGTSIEQHALDAITRRVEALEAG